MTAELPSVERRRTTTRSGGFTLIEVMMAVLLMAMLASAAALSFSGSLRVARSADAVDQIRSFDAAARQMAKRSRGEVRVVFELGGGTLSRREGPALEDLRVQVRLPAGYSVDEVRVAGQIFSDGEAVIDYSSLGLSRSYAVWLKGPGLDQWLLFAGLSGEMTRVQDESEAESILERGAPTTYRPWDSTRRNDAD